MPTDVIPVPADLDAAYPITTTADLLRRYGVSQSTLYRWARQRGLRKTAAHVSAVGSAARRHPDEVPGMKRCIGCGELKTKTHFYRASGRRLQSRCKPCHQARTTEWRAANPEKVSRILRKRSLRQLYDISPAGYDGMLAAQNGGCAICETAPTGETPRTRHLHVDHDHMTGRVRGLLCNSCNNGIGRFRHEPALLRNAIRYLQAGAS